MLPVHGTLTRDGFKAVKMAINPSEDDLAPKRAPSDVAADVMVVGECLTGKIVDYETYPEMSLSSVRLPYMCMYDVFCTYAFMLSNLQG